MTKASKENVVLNRVPCIHHPVYFWKDQDEMLALIDLESEVNVMTPTYALKLGLKVYPTNVEA